MRTVLIFVGCLLLTTWSGGNTASAQSSVLQRYIDSAFVTNLVLQQKNISLEKAAYALQTARSWYLPTIAFQAGYQTADGGRDIQLPLGDLLNGVYSTLNQLTQSGNFPQLKNESVNFLPYNFYDAKIRTTVPIINPDIHYNKKIAEGQVNLNGYEIDVYKRELVKNIKQAYFNYLAALHTIDIYKSALVLAEEGKRVNEKLLENGKGLPAYVIRASSEIEQIKSKVVEAEQQASNASNWFNFLLNKPLASVIDTTYDIRGDLAGITVVLNSEQLNTGREELSTLKEVLTLQQTVVQMNKAVYYPRLNGFLDLGSQAQHWKFNNQSRYYMVGVQLDVPIFSGNRNRIKIRQAYLDVKNAALNLEQTKQQLDVNVNNARNNLLSAYTVLLSTEKQLESVQTYQRLIDRGYKEGVNTYIETVDARNQLTQARLAVILQKSRVLSAATILERETASFKITQ